MIKDQKIGEPILVATRTLHVKRAPNPGGKGGDENGWEPGAESASLSRRALSKSMNGK